MERKKFFVYIRRALRLLLILFEAAVLFMFVSQMPLGIRNVGAIFGVCISALALLVTIFAKTAVKVVRHICGSKAGKAVAVFASSIFVLLSLYAAVLSLLMLAAILNVPKNPDAVVVLGCRVQRNAKPSLMLSRRLEAAFEFLSENEDVICIVSGGKGEDEPISEGEAMKVALVQMGVAEERIFVEDKSENTQENIDFSVKMLKEMGIEPKEVTIVTDGFHLYRARVMAKQTGVYTTSVGADTPWWLAPAYWFREWFALSYLFVFGY